MVTDCKPLNTTLCTLSTRWNPCASDVESTHPCSRSRWQMSLSLCSPPATPAASLAPSAFKSGVHARFCSTFQGSNGSAFPRRGRRRVALSPNPLPSLCFPRNPLDGTFETTAVSQRDLSDQSGERYREARGSNERHGSIVP